MLQMDNFLYATNLAEAYDTLVSEPGAVVLGGCGYLRLGARSIKTAIDLSRLDLDFIREKDGLLEIGAMTSLRSLEVSPLTTKLFSGLLARAVRDIVGVQWRNAVTLGGTVAGRYPFSDPITALLALDARVIFHHLGEVSLEEYLGDSRYKDLKDIIEKIVISVRGKDGIGGKGDQDHLAAFTSIRKARTDFAVLNVAVAKNGDTYRIVVGSRPGRAKNVPEAADYLQKNGLNAATAAEAGKIAAAHLQFGDNPRGSGRYRQAVCPVLIERALSEVIYAA